MIVFAVRGVYGHGEKNAKRRCGADGVVQRKLRVDCCIKRDDGRMKSMISRRFQDCHIMLTEEETQHVFKLGRKVREDLRELYTLASEVAFLTVKWGFLIARRTT